MALRHLLACQVAKSGCKGTTLFWLHQIFLKKNAKIGFYFFFECS